MNMFKQVLNVITIWRSLTIGLYKCALDYPNKFVVHAEAHHDHICRPIIIPVLITLTNNVCSSSEQAQQSLLYDRLRMRNSEADLSFLIGFSFFFV
jgi:hypothetical protein